MVGCQILTLSPFNLSYSFFLLSLPLSLLSVSLFHCHNLSLPTLRSRLLGFLAEHRDRRKKKKKKNRRSNLWRTSLLKCATFYFSANYPHAVHRLKAVLWLSLQLGKAATMTHNAAGVSWQGEAVFFRVLTLQFVVCIFFFFHPFKACTCAIQSHANYDKCLIDFVCIWVH